MLQIKRRYEELETLTAGSKVERSNFKFEDCISKIIVTEAAPDGLLLDWGAKYDIPDDTKVVQK